MTKSKSDFRTAEALGHIKTMPEHVEAPKDDIKDDGVIDDPEEFRMAIANAQLEGIDHVVVSERVMKYLMRGHRGTSLTYGDPGVRVFLKGTKEDTERMEKLSAEAFHEEYIKLMRGETVEKERQGK